MCARRSSNSIIQSFGENRRRTQIIDDLSKNENLDKEIYYIQSHSFRFVSDIFCFRQSFSPPSPPASSPAHRIEFDLDFGFGAGADVVYISHTCRSRHACVSLLFENSIILLQQILIFNILPLIHRCTARAHAIQIQYVRKITENEHVRFFVFGWLFFPVSISSSSSFVLGYFTFRCKSIVCNTRCSHRNLNPRLPMTSCTCFLEDWQNRNEHIRRNCHVPCSPHVCASICKVYNVYARHETSECLAGASFDLITPVTNCLNVSLSESPNTKQQSVDQFSIILLHIWALCAGVIRSTIKYHRALLEYSIFARYTYSCKANRAPARIIHPKWMRTENSWLLAHTHTHTNLVLEK